MNVKKGISRENSDLHTNFKVTVPSNGSLKQKKGTGKNEGKPTEQQTGPNRNNKQEGKDNNKKLEKLPRPWGPQGLQKKEIKERTDRNSCK